MYFISSIFAALIFTCWMQSTTITGGYFSYLAYKKNWKSFWLFLTSAILPGSIMFYVFWNLMCGNWHRDAQDGIVLLIIPIGMWLLFLLILGLGSIYFIFDKTEPDKERNPYYLCWLTLPAILIAWTLIGVFVLVGKNASR